MQGMKMKKARVIKLLEYVKEIEDETQTRKDTLKDLELYYDTSAGLAYDGMSGGPQNHISNPTERTAMKVPDFVRKEIRRYTEEINILQHLRTEIIKEVLRLDMKHKKVVILFYIRDLQWQQVSEELCYSERQCKNIRDEAVEKLACSFQMNKVIASFEMKA